MKACTWHKIQKIQRVYQLFTPTQKCGNASRFLGVNASRFLGVWSLLRRILKLWTWQAPPSTLFFAPLPLATHPSLPDQQDGKGNERLTRGCRVPDFVPFCALPRNAHPSGVRWAMEEQASYLHCTGDGSPLLWRFSHLAFMVFVPSGTGPWLMAGLAFIFSRTWDSLQHSGFRYSMGPPSACDSSCGPRDSACIAHPPLRLSSCNFGSGLREDAGRWSRQGRDAEQGRTGSGHISPTILSDIREIGARVFILVSNMCSKRLPFPTSFRRGQRHFRESGCR